MRRFSLIIPAYNESNYLPRLLDTVAEARTRYHGASDALVTIVADNNSTDATAQIALDRGCKLVKVERRCIASVRNAGAASAESEILCFVDADMRVHRETFNAIDNCIASGKVVAGATGIVLERMSLGIALTYGLILPVVWLTKIDTGVVFCRNSDFARQATRA
jgi:glycosyltransferase involved in cell wall biosynthesis